MPSPMGVPRDPSSKRERAALFRLPALVFVYRLHKRFHANALSKLNSLYQLAFNMLNARLKIKVKGFQRKGRKGKIKPELLIKKRISVMVIYVFC